MAQMIQLPLVWTFSRGDHEAQLQGAPNLEAAAHTIIKGGSGCSRDNIRLSLVGASLSCLLQIRRRRRSDQEYTCTTASLNLGTMARSSINTSCLLLVAAMVAILAVVVEEVHGQGAAAQPAPAPQPAAASTVKPYKKGKLAYYVQVKRGHPSMGILLQPINATYSNQMGFTTIFALNATKKQSNTSKAVGVVRGYTVDISYTVDYAGFESAVVSYDDGVYKGAIFVQAMQDGTSAEVAVLGGTGSFRGVRGWGTVTQALLGLPDVIYYHTLHFSSR